MRRFAMAMAWLMLASLAACTTAPKPKVRFDAVYLDMDGTLLGHDAHPRQASLEAIRAVQACGGRVGLATGRTYVQVKELLPAIGPDLPVVLYNGALIARLDGTVVHVDYLPADVVAPALQATAGLSEVWGVVIHEIENTYVDRDDADLNAFIKRAYIVPEKVIEDPAANYQGRPVKLLYVTRKGQTEAVKAALDGALGTRARALITSPYTVEVVANGVNKAAAIRRVLSEQAIDPRNAIVFGDSGNDVEMLSELGPGFAMGNCRPRACDAALARIGDHDTDAIADVLRKVVLTPQCMPVAP